MTHPSSAPPGRASDSARIALWLHVILMTFLGVSGLLLAGAFADLYDIPATVVRLVGAGSLLVAAVLAVYVRSPRWRDGLAVGGGLNILLGGTLLGLAPSAPDRGGAALLVIVAVLLAVLSMAEFKIHGPRAARPPDPLIRD